MLLLWGSQDEVFPVEQHGARMKQFFPHAEGPIVLDRCRHFMQDDQGPEIVAAMIEFFNRRLGARR